MRTRIAAQGPQRCSCRAVACGGRGVSCDMGRRPLVRRRWRLGSPFPARRGCLPGPATASVAATASASIKDAEIVPSCPARCQMISRSRRAAVSDATRRPSRRHASWIRPRRPSVRARGAIRAQCRCISPATPGCASIPETAPRRRQPARLPRQRRIPAGRPVSRSVGAPADHSRARRLQRRFQNSIRHQGGTRKEFLSACAAAALQAGSTPRHYRIPATTVVTPQRACVVQR